MAMIEAPMQTRADLESPAQTEEFRALAARKDLFSVTLTLAVMAIYFGFLFLIAFRKDLVGAKLSPHVTWGIPLGIGVILASWLLTGIYVFWANRSGDKMVEAFRRKWIK